MATFLFSERADGDIILFDPALDVLRFDTSGFGAADAMLDTPTVTSTRFTPGGETFTLVCTG